MTTNFIEQIKEDLKSFASTSPLESAKNLLARLGVRYSTVTDDPIDIGELYKKAAASVKAEIPKSVKAVFDRIETSWFLGGVSEETFAGTETQTSFETASEKADDQKHNGMFIFLLRMKDGAPLTRTDAAQLTRGINRIMKSKPATVFIVEGQGDKTLLSIATCERTTYKQDWRPGEKLGRVSILKGVNCASPHRGHLDILVSMDVKKCKTFDALYAQWQKVFSTDVLTKSFYHEIQDWYFWAMSKYVCVQFPNDLDDNTDDEKYNAENLIRLITRMLFTWFMKAKGLVNPDLFEPSFLKTALKHFDPEASVEDSNEKDAEKKCTYYRAILQNLFFATFNQEIKERGFVEKKKGLDKKHYHIKNYYRNADLFKTEDQQKIIGYFAKSPFVNGGLFECLDNVLQLDKNKKEHEYSWDGFSNYVHFRDGSRKGSLKSALIPDCLFFGSERVVDLSSFYENNKAAERSTVRGLVNILKDYVFTIEENTPLDEDVALDPELLGKVFENLLGCYNEETKKTARNDSGSFYTPRKIVSYMVKASIKNHLLRSCNGVDETEVDKLLDGESDLSQMPSVKAHAKEILGSIFKVRILDPACGSGAFPMGILLSMVDILRTVDPTNEYWHEIVLNESLAETEDVSGIVDQEERENLKKQIYYDFNERVDHPDYARKLYLIEHCIFGSDILPIAVQVSRLRFFITLLCEQTKTDDPAKNYGITPLPNLENNFVAADSLLSLDLADMRKLLKGKTAFLSLVKELRFVRHQLFSPKTADKKARLKAKDRKLCERIAEAVESLYDEDVEEKIRLHQNQIERINDAVAKLTEDDFKETEKSVTEADFFAGEKVTKILVKGKGQTLLQQKEEQEKEIAKLKNSSRKEQLLSDIKRLVRWNPFAFNTAVDFLDPEWMFGVKDGFDIVIGNPPYVKVKGDDPHIGYYKDQYKAGSCGRMNLYKIFVERGLRLLKCGCVFTYIMPNSYLADNSVALRDFLLQRRLIEIVEYTEKDKVFENVAQAVTTIVVVNDSPSREHMCRIITAKQGDVCLRQSAFLLNERHFLVPMSSIVLKMCTRVKNSLAEWFDIFQGEINLTSKATFFGEDKKSNSLPMWRGDNVGKYVPSSYPFEFCMKDATRRTHWKFPRIVMKQVTNQQSLFRTAAFVSEEEYFCGNSTNYLLPKNAEVPVNEVLGLLNSKAFNYLFSYFSFTNHITTAELISVKVPGLDELINTGVGAIVQKILDAKKGDPSADTSSLEAEIDSLVFDLYGLTAAERAIVMGKGASS